MPLGASILDLLPIPPGTQSAIPAGLRSFLERFTAVNLSSSTTTAATLHYGTLLPTVEDTGIQDAIRGWSIEGAGFDRGVRFQLATTRVLTVNNIEPQPTALQLDLLLEQVSIVVPSLKAARLIPGSGTTPAHLVPDAASPEVRLTGNAILRITNGTTGWAGPFLVDFPDPLVPGTSTGAVASMQFVPPHFFVANSAIGLTVRQLTFDASGSYTPADIMARNHGPDWTGLAINEALLYLPRETPLVGNLVLGVRDVLLGDPFGMQGELRVEWGADATTATPVQVNQATDENGFAAITVTSTEGEFDRSVVIDPARPLRFFAQVTSGPGTDATVRWILPDGSRANGLLTPEFRARAGDTLVCIRSETPEGGSTPVDGPEIRHHFSAPQAVVAKITLAHGGQSHANAVHVSGSREAIAAAGLVFTADPAPTDPETMTWQLGNNSTAPVVSGATFTLNGTAGLPASGRVDLVLDDGSGGARRVRIHCLERASLLIGAEEGVFDADGAVLVVQAVERTVALNLFHDDGSLVPAANPAELGAGGLVVPTNTLAQVTVDNVEPVIPSLDRHVRVRMVFDEASPAHEGEDIEAVEQLLSDFPGSRLVLIGRCDDVGDAAYNAVLARERAAAMRDRLIALGVAAELIVYRGEQDDPVAGWVGDGALPDLADLGVPDSQQGDDWYAYAQEPAHPLPNTPEESGDLRARREEYRRVDIYAEGDAATTAAQPPADAAFAPTLRRAWVPGPDGESPALPMPSSPELIHRVSVRVAWDSPTATTLADFVPTLAEVTVAYESERLSEPANMPAELPGTSVGTGSGTTNDVEVLTVTGRWTYDARSGETLFAASVDSTGDPLGLFYVDGDAVALAAAFGPAVVATVSPAFDGAGAVGIAGVAIAAAVLQGAVKNGTGRVVCTGLAVEQKQRALDTLAGSQQQMLFDYESSFDVDLRVVGVLHLTTSKPLKIRYRDVGIRLDWSKTNWWEIASFVYEGISMEVVEPGQWQIEGPLGKFLGIVAVRMGTGSTWFEVDMAFNLDLGVVRLTSATIRIVAEKDAPLSVEIRGLGVALSIPGVLEGSGTAVINADGSVAATLDVNVVAAGLTARAELELKPELAYVAISVSVILPVGIPLANTGLGIFGFVGQFVSNGQRTLVVPINEDPVQAELDWYEAELAKKWGPEPGQWALGLGVIIGTLPDMGFTFNAQGMFVVTFPDPSVILGIDAKLLASPGQATDEPQPLDAEMRLIGLAVIDPEAVMIGVRGTYSIPKVLTVNVPLSAYFPLAGDPRGSYVHLGSDNITAESKVGIFSRAGDPVSMTLLPGVLDANAWAYFMLEERELHWLGNDETFSFDGFSVGFGAGWNLTWKAGPLTLDASAQVLVGLGISPFKLVGGVWVDGLLDAKIGSVGVSGNLVAEVIYQDREIKTYLSGEFCGEIDLPLVPPVKKCIEIKIGDNLVDAIPAPAHPLKGVDLTDRRGNRVAVATDSTPGEDHTVWPDTVPVLGFSHVPEVGPDLEADWTLAARPNNPSPWAGSSELKYAFRLDRVELLAKNDDEDFVKVDGPLDAVFWLPTHRGGVLSEDEDAIWPSEHEGAALALLSWVPFTIFRHLAKGGEGLPADPADTMSEVCDTITIGHETCAPGVDAKQVEPGRISIRSRRDKGDPVAAVFTVFGTATLGGMSWRELALALTHLGLHPVAKGIVDLALPVSLPDGRRALRGFELPGIGQTGPRYASLGWEGRFEPAIASGQVVLEVCDQGFGVQGPRRCFPFDGVNRVKGEDRWDTAGLRFVKTVTPAGATHLVGTNGLLVIGTGTVRVIFPFPVSWASLSVAHPLGVATMTIKGLRGHVLGRRVIPRNSGSQTVVIEDIGPFAELVVVSLDARLGIDAVCVHAGLGDADGPLEIPPLMGQRLDGELVVWKSEVLAKKTLGDGRRCRQVLYSAPDAGGWQAIGVPAMQSATIRLVGVCGLTTTLRQVRVRDQKARDTLKNGWNLKAGLTTETRPLLGPATEYKLRVGMSWAGWRPGSPGAQPPATVADASWQTLPDVELSFLTAAEDTVDESAPPASLQAEVTFDPRAVSRYLIGFEPEGANSPPHLLDDALLAHFEVDHIEQLLRAYGRTLALTVRRTDPPAGSVANGSLAIVALEIERCALEPARLDMVDERVITSLRAEPRCLATNVNTGGVTLSITAELEPNAEYDLALFAPPEGDADDESLLIARTHFRSSRYADVSAMLAGLGFGLAERAVMIPFDFVISNGAAMPAPGTIASDAALDEALRTIGMDPWPVLHFGRTVAIWRPGAAAGEFLLTGLLLESPEPIERGERCGVTRALVIGGASDVVLTASRVNSAGTRILLATGAADGLPLDSDTLTLELQVRDRLVARTGTRAMRSVPRIVYQELL